MNNGFYTVMRKLLPLGIPALMMLCTCSLNDGDSGQQLAPADGNPEEVVIEGSLKPASLEEKVVAIVYTRKPSYGKEGGMMTWKNTLSDGTANRNL